MNKAQLQALVEQKPTLKEKLQLLLPLVATVGQKEYDAWEQDEQGYNEELGHGGICHLIAEGVAEELDEYIPNGLHMTVSATHMQHVFVSSFIRHEDGEIEGYTVDIYPYLYETGGGFCWKKIPDVVFDSSMVELYPISADDYLTEDELDYMGWNDE